MSKSLSLPLDAGVAEKATPKAGRVRIAQRLSGLAGLSRIASPLVLLLLWELASRLGWLPTRIIAAPSAIVGTFAEMVWSGELPSHMLVSLARIAKGLSISIFTGTALALIAGLSRRGEIIVDSPLQMLRTLPFLALVPLFILWFGIGETPKIALIAFGTVFPIYLNLYSGIRSIDVKLIEAGISLGLTRAELIVHVILPGALPSFLVGLRYSLGISWLSLVAVEQINATAGLGYLVNSARDFMRTDIIVVCLLVYSLLGLFTDFLVRTIERHALAWRPSFLRS
ncbi:putative aliphatic sulfonates transport permease protein SsuC [Andreprevotia sp. IGB-42]|uniref:ABC transporter permease subunit n=1 Tax=Andreprevotia sp. IGB-42 TaxID=2497473 RepID=UPI00135C3798|nr:ABC transporter permease subunit [Andreprevotia sp. IGB-42]KAF0812638.1 putative aliphatic sulfonates transport permease protein SsuC [Andreprevotia sp. IGB-42]